MTLTHLHKTMEIEKITIDKFEDEDVDSSLQENSWFKTNI